MLDVHPPHEPIRGFRDFLLHLLTITIGLLIALGLEAGVEALHHRHQREEAETTILREISDNRKLLQKTQNHTEAELKVLEKALVFLEDLRSGKKDDPSGIQLGFNAAPLQSAGWSTASLTGVLNYMPYDEVQRFATAYHEQQMYEDSVTGALVHYEVLDSYLLGLQKPVDMKPQDVEAAIADVRRSIADLGAMRDWGRGTLSTYDDALKR